MVVLFSVVSVGAHVSVHQHVNSLTVRDIIMKFVSEQDMVKTSDKFENGFIAAQCGAQVLS